MPRLQSRRPDGVSRLDGSRGRRKYRGRSLGDPAGRTDRPRSDRAVEPIAGVAETGHDVALLVQALVEGAEHQRDIAVAPRGLLDRSDALGGAEQADRGDVIGAAVEEELDRDGEGSAGGEHRIDREALPPAQVFGQTLGVGRRLEGLLVADHAEESDLRRRSSFTKPLEHAETSTQDRRHDRRSSEIFTPIRVVHRGVSDRRHPHVARRLVGEQRHELLGELRGTRRRGALIAQHRQLVGDEGVIGHVNAHTYRLLVPGCRALRRIRAVTASRRPGNASPATTRSRSPRSAPHDRRAAGRTARSRSRPDPRSGSTRSPARARPRTGRSIRC